MDRPSPGEGAAFARSTTRAGRNGLDFIAQGGDPSLVEVYDTAARANGHEPGFCMIPPIDTATTVFVAEDVDRAWDELGRHLLHDVTTYASINVGNTHTASISTATSVEELRKEDCSHRIVTVEECGVHGPLGPATVRSSNAGWRCAAGNRLALDFRTVTDVVYAGSHECARQAESGPSASYRAVLSSVSAMRSRVRLIV